MRLLCDMGVSMRVVQWLRDQGHDCTHLRDQGLERLRDEEVFGKASSETRIILTFDLDFAEIVAMAGTRLPSVILLRLHNTRSNHVIDRLSVVLEPAAEPLQRGAVVVVEEAQIRIRELPIGGTE